MGNGEVLMKEKIRRIMVGRYGLDQLSEFTIICAIICGILSMFFKSTAFRTIGLLLLVCCYVRMFSRNIVKRYDENVRFLNYKEKVMAWIRTKKDYLKQRKIYHIYKCPNCKQKIRIPKGKGKVCITCPSCKNEFIKNS